MGKVLAQPDCQPITLSLRSAIPAIQPGMSTVIQESLLGTI
jgi:hypothetical protein